MLEYKNLDVDVRRDLGDIADELVPHRNSKVEKDIDFPTKYRADVYAAETDAEYAFNKAFADSEIKSVIHVGTEDDFSATPANLKKMLQHTGDSEAKTDLEVLPRKQPQHVPVLQDTVDTLHDAGYSDAYVEITSQATATSLTETIETLEEQGAYVSVKMSEGPQGEEVIGNDLYTAVRYDPIKQAVEPDVSISVPENTSREVAEEVQSELEEVLDRQGLLRD